MGKEEEGMGNGEGINYTLVGPASSTMIGMSLSCAVNCSTEYKILF